MSDEFDKLNKLVEATLADPTINRLFDSIEAALAEEREQFRQDLWKALEPIKDRYQDVIIFHVLLAEATAYLQRAHGSPTARRMLELWVEAVFPTDPK